MGRIIAIDYGQKRVGLAVTDELKIIANALTTIHSKDIFVFLKDYVSKENVEAFVVGKPLQMNAQESESARFIEPFVRKLQQTFPHIPIHRTDERFTSKMAQQTILEAGIKKKQRQDKGMVDRISAVIMLQYFLAYGK